MEKEGPVLQTLTRRLAECPAEFLEEPGGNGRGRIHVAAVVSDVRRALGGAVLAADEAIDFQRRASKVERNRLRLILITCWLLNDPWFTQRKRFSEKAFQFLAAGLDELSKMIDAQKFVTDPDRREELARLCLKWLDLRPAGETEAQAEDRLTTLSSVERERVIRATREAEKRRREILKAMAEKAAYEGADKWSRE